jgi:MerR family transcriptional regulator, light-induced transcriptional regulator
VKDLLSPKQVARAIGVSESSLKRWCDQGLIPTVRTAGGHRRLPISGVLNYLRSSKQELVAPQLLGLPATSGKTGRVVDRGRDQLSVALLAGDEGLCRQIVFDLWLAGQSLSTLCDQAIAAAFTDIGDQWACHEADVYQERRACEVMLRLLHEIRMGLPPGDPQWKAIGGTIEGDQYTLPTTMVEAILQDAGWESRSLGSSLPFASLATAIRETRPRLIWVSVSYIADPALFLREFSTLNQAADEVGAAIVVGGFAMSGVIRQQIRYSAFCDTMQHLEQFANTLRGVATRPPE